MENTEEITIKIKTMDEAIFEFKVDVKGKIKDLKNQIKEVSLTFNPSSNSHSKFALPSCLTHLGPGNPFEKVENRVYGQTDPG